MEIFSEIYNCYFQVLRHLLCKTDAVTIQEIRAQIRGEGFEESMLSIIPKIEDGSWNVFWQNEHLYLSKIKSSFLTPLSNLEKSYLKSLLYDPRIGLFLSEEQLQSLHEMLFFVPPLWKQEQFFYFDRFADGDPYQDENYRRNFRILLSAQKKKQYVDLDYTSPKGTRVHHYYVPARLEYSVKNDKFRLLALEYPKHNKTKPELFNIDRIQSVRTTEKFLSSNTDLNAIIRKSYDKEPLTLHITNRRNALERAMLHFANYEKNTKKLDENTYECRIYYNQNMETELLIEVMSFGPMLKVVGNDKFIKNIKARLRMQKEIMGDSSK